MQKDLEHYYKSTTKGLRNAERARKFCSKNTNERIIVSCLSHTPKFLCSQFHVTCTPLYPYDEHP